MSGEYHPCSWALRAAPAILPPPFAPTNLLIFLVVLPDHSGREILIFLFHPLPVIKGFFFFSPLTLVWYFLPL